VFLHNVDLWRVAPSSSGRAPEWLALSLATMLVNLAIRASGGSTCSSRSDHTSFASSFRADGSRACREQRAARARWRGHSPYFLARQAGGRPDGGERMSATGAFATIILESCSTR